MTDLWGDDDEVYNGDFAADLDALVEEHQKKAQLAGPVQGSSQVLATANPSLAGPQEPPQQPPVLVHHLYGPATKQFPAVSGLPPARPYNSWTQQSNQQSNRNGHWQPNQNSGWNPQNTQNRGSNGYSGSWNTRQVSTPQQSTARPWQSNGTRPQLNGGISGVWAQDKQPTHSPGVFGDSPSPGGVPRPNAAAAAPPRPSQAASSRPPAGFDLSRINAQPTNTSQVQLSTTNQLRDANLGQNPYAAGSIAQRPPSTVGARPPFKPPSQPVAPDGVSMPWNKPADSQPGKSQPPKGLRLRDLYGKKGSQPARSPSPGNLPSAAPAKGSTPAAVNVQGMSTLLQAQLSSHLEESEDAATVNGLPQPHSNTQLLREQETAMATLRGQLEQAEREKQELQRRLSQHSATTSMPAVNGFMAPTQGDLLRQLETAHKNMAFKEEELLDARRKHADVLDGQKRADANALQYKSELLRSEALRVQLEHDLKQAQAEKALKAMEVLEGPSHEHRPQLKRKLNEIDTDDAGEPSKPDGTLEASEKVKKPSDVKTRSVGTNTTAIAEATARQEVWEIASFEGDDSSQQLWTDIWVSADAAVSFLMMNHRWDEPSLAALNLPELELAEMKRLVYQIGKQVQHLPSCGDKGLGLLSSLTQFLHGFAPAILRASVANSVGANLLDWQSAALNLLSALLRSSEHCWRCAELSCQSESTSSAREAQEAPSHKERSNPRSQLTLAEQMTAKCRVTLHSKGQVLRPLPRLKDRPPDLITVQELRHVGGLMKVLINLLVVTNQISSDNSSDGLKQFTEAILDTLEALLSHQASDAAAVQLCASGCLDGVVQRRTETMLPMLLRIAQKTLIWPECQHFLVRRQSSPAQVQQETNSPRSLTYSLLEAPLLCFQSAMEVQVFDLNLARNSLVMLASLLEISAWQPLRALLTESSDHCMGPPLSQRIMFTANCIFANVKSAESRAKLADGDPDLSLVTLQECLLFLRCLFSESACALAVADDLISTPAAQRTCLALTSYLMNWQVPADVQSPQGVGATICRLAPWAMALGAKYTGRQFYARGEADQGADVGEIAYLAQSIRRRVLHQLDQGH